MRTKWEQRVGRLSQLENGLWRGAVVGYPLYLLSSIETSLDEESLPLHVLGARRPQEEAALAQYVLRHADVFCHYAPWMFALHTRAWKKEQAVIGKVIDDNLEIDWTPVVEEFGLDLLIRQVGLARVVEEVGLARVVEEVGVDRLLDSLTPEQLAKLKARL